MPLAMSLGNWYYKKGEFEKAIEMFQHSFGVQLELLKAKSLLIRAWYELYEKNDNYYDMLSNQIEAFEKYIRREKSIPESLSEGYLKFIKCTMKLLNKREGIEKETELKARILNEPNVVFKNWLLEKTK